jgi:peptidyl-tRNA hydrolase
LIVYKSFLAGKYPVLSASDAALQLKGLNVRLGSYGDIAAIPAHILHSLMRFTANNTGYTHQWKRKDMEHLKVFTMASCDTLEEHLEATRKGWRTFLVVPKGSTSIPAKTFLCPASEEAGKKLTCDQCLACNGSRDNRSASVYIPVHGVSFKQKRFTEQLIQIGRA